MTRWDSLHTARTADGARLTLNIWRFWLRLRCCWLVFPRLLWYWFEPWFGRARVDVFDSNDTHLAIVLSHDENCSAVSPRTWRLASLFKNANIFCISDKYSINLSNWRSTMGLNSRILFVWLWTGRNRTQSRWECLPRTLDLSTNTAQSLWQHPSSSFAAWIGFGEGYTQMQQLTVWKLLWKLATGPRIGKIRAARRVFEPRDETAEQPDKVYRDEQVHLWRQRCLTSSALRCSNGFLN